MTDLSERIISMRDEGATYSQIQKVLGCSKSVISYHLSVGGKDRNLDRQRRRRASSSLIEKTERFKRPSVINVTNTSTSSPVKLSKQMVTNFSREGQYSDQEFTYEDVMEREGVSPVCYLTGDSIDFHDPSSYSFDHIVPRSRGGNNSLSNLGLTTKIANRMKSDMLLEEFLEMCEKVLKHHGRL